jgi:diguanylate cyclase (GGDEF)-like protein/PAS domain S-box-containing protein
MRGLCLTGQNATFDPHCSSESPMLSPSRSADAQFYLSILDNLQDGVYFVDRDRRITYWSGGAERLTGYQAEEVVGTCCHDNVLMHVSEEGKLLCHDGCPLAATMNDGEPREAHVYLHHRDGHRVPVRVHAAAIRDAEGTIVGAAESFGEVTIQADLHRRLEELKRLAFDDAVTGLGNRRFVELALRSKLREAEETGIPMGLLFIDIDHFKKVNDQHGHEVGDALLRMVSHTLSVNSRPLDVVGRWGGEEFLVLLFNVDLPTMRAIAERLTRLVRRSSLTLAAGTLSVTVSVGGTMLRAKETASAAVERADALMYRAKEAGRDRAVIG